MYFFAFLTQLVSIVITSAKYLKQCYSIFTCTVDDVLGKAK